MVGMKLLKNTIDETGITETKKSVRTDHVPVATVSEGRVISIKESTAALHTVPTSDNGTNGITKG